MMFVMSDDLDGLTTDQKIDYLFEILHDIHSTVYLLNMQTDVLERLEGIEYHLELLNSIVIKNYPSHEELKKFIDTPCDVWEEILASDVKEKFLLRYDKKFLQWIYEKSKNGWLEPFPSAKQVHYAFRLLEDFKKRKTLGKKTIGLFYKIKTSLSL